MAMVGASIGLTFALSLVGAPPLYAAIGMGGLFALTGVLAIAAIGVVVWVVPPAPAKVHHEDRAHWLEVVRDPQLLRLNVGIFVLHAVQMATFIVVPVLLVERGGLELARHWQVYLPVVLVSFGLMMPPIIAAERRGRVRTLFLGSIALMLFVQLGYALLSASLAWLVLWLLLFFIAFNILEASLPSLTSRMAPASAKGLALGIYNTTQAIGLFAGGALGGWLVSHAGASSVFFAAAALLAAWWLLATGMREPPRRARGEPVPIGEAASH
jgi:predicted MFS family arabinose efflux permease